MSYASILKEQIGNRLLVVHTENGIDHGVVLRIEAVDDKIVTGVTDRGIKHWITLDTIIKVRETRECVSDERNTNTKPE